MHALPLLRTFCALLALLLATGIVAGAAHAQTVLPFVLQDAASDTLLSVGSDGLLTAHLGLRFADGTEQTTASAGDWSTTGSVLHYTDGRVGIGTSTPGSVIANSWLDIVGGHVALANDYGVFSYNSAGTGIGAGFDTTPSDGLDLYAGGVPRLRINSTGAIAMGNGTVASGTHSTATGNNTVASDAYSTAMGHVTTASGAAAFAVGHTTTASGSFSVAMGQHTTASGLGSVALGSRASTNGRHGTFIFGDNSTVNTVVPFNVDNSFVVRASGGFVFRTNSQLSTGCRLNSGSGSWDCTSSRAEKTDFEDLDGEDVLARLAAIPVQRWRYNGEDSGVRHVGPTAEDFFEAFGLGNSDESIGHIDAAGITMRAVQALEARTRTRAGGDARIEALERENQELRDRLAALESAVARLTSDASGNVILTATPGN